MKMRTLAVIFIFVFGTIISMAQEIEKPVNPKLLWVHQTEMGFLLGRQTIENNYWGGYYSSALYDSRSSLPPYYYSGSGKFQNFTIQHFSGIQIKKIGAVGLTAGFDYYGKNIITPLSLGFRKTLIPSKKVSPTIGIDTGFGFVWNNEQDKQADINRHGGLLANPAAGFRIKLSNDGSALFVNIGYRHQRSGYIFENENFSKTQEINKFNRLSVRLGISF